jgi:hypothetical protein
MVFYELQVGRARKFIESAGSNDWQSIACAKDPGHQRAGRRLTALHVDVLSWNVTDFSRTMLSDIVITDYALKVLSEGGLSGFEVKSTILETAPEGVRQADLPKLWEFVVTGRGGAASKRSGIVELSRCLSCGLVRYSAFENGIWVDERSYDGSDFFSILEYPKYVLVSHRARDLIVRSKLTNAKFVESSKLEWPKGVIKSKAR